MKNNFNFLSEFFLHIRLSLFLHSKSSSFFCLTLSNWPRPKTDKDDKRPKKSLRKQEQFSSLTFLWHTVTKNNKKCFFLNYNFSHFIKKDIFSSILLDSYHFVSHKKKLKLKTFFLDHFFKLILKLLFYKTSWSFFITAK